MAASITVLTPKHFHIIPDDIIDVHGKTIGAIGYAIYGYLRRCLNRKTGQCNPSISSIAEAFALARSTVKVHLRILQEVGLVAVEARKDPAGDPTSNQYTLLDPSPAAVEQRRLARQAAAAFERGRSPADPPPPEGVGRLPTGGGSPADPPGRPPAAPEPDLSLEPEEENQAGAARAAEETPTTPPRPPCPHPLEERSHFGAVAVCQHCWTLLDTQAEPVPGAPAPGEEGHAHSAARVA